MTRRPVSVTLCREEVVMAYTLEEFRKLDLNALFAEHPVLCASCQKPITESNRSHGHRTPSGEKIHEDCYFDGLSDLLEEHPPGIPGIRR
ncbi:MAG: hypothetical protein ABIO72_04235 [Patescibacteria group bacterium]